MNVPFEKLEAEFKRVLVKLGFSDKNAALCAHTFAGNSRDGIYSHGLNRFPAFVQFINEGIIKYDAVPLADGGFGAMERWDGSRGPGILNAHFCMDRAINLANQYGIGCVALRNTSHWMRGGTYGLQAAEAGMIGICFTNTIANLPPWGGIDPRLGNNPLVIAVPRKGGHILLDMAISQYSFGKLHTYKANNEKLPLPGGYDSEGHITDDPAAIIESRRPLPIGFWKGAGLSLMLDLLATLLSQGRSTAKISQVEKEAGVSQVFICIKPGDDAQANLLIEEIIAYTQTSRPVENGGDIRYPGENMLKTKARSMQEGVWVEEKIWATVLAM